MKNGAPMNEVTIPTGMTVGEKTVLGAFEARADYVARVDATGDPRAAFKAAVDDFFTTRLSLL